MFKEIIALSLSEEKKNKRNAFFDVTAK